MPLTVGNETMAVSGSGGSSANTSAAIQAVSDFEFIKQFTVADGSTYTRMSDGIDFSIYSTHYFVCEDMKTSQQDYPRVRLLDTSLDALNGSMISHRHTTSYANSNTSNTANTSNSFIFNGSNPYTTTDIWNMDFEITQTTSRIIGYFRTSMGRYGGHWPQHTTGNFIVDRTDSSYGKSISAVDVFTSLSQGTIKLYGRRIRTS